MLHLLYDIRRFTMERLFFEKLANFDRNLEPCSVAIPFPKGKLYDINQVIITDGKGQMKSQAKVTGYWDDGSIKWGLIYFLVDLPANQSKEYFYDIQEQTQEYESEFKIENTGDVLSIDNGVIQLKLNQRKGKNLFAEMKRGEFLLDESQIQGPIIQDAQSRWIAKVSSPWEILERGPVVTQLRAYGKHKNENHDGFMDYMITLWIYADKPWIKMDYKMINKEQEDFQFLKSIQLNFQFYANHHKIKRVLGISNYQTRLIEGTSNDKVFYMIDEEHMLKEANEHMPEVFYGTFFADWTDEEKGGVCATLYQAHQNFPKAFEINNHQLSIQLLPEQSEGLKFYQGMAKTHTLFLYFHKPSEDIMEINKRSLHFQCPDRPVLSPHVYQKANVYGNIFTDKKINQVEATLINRADRRGKAYGILHWGDAPDSGYTQQGRGNGAPVWTNNEYDFPHAVMQMYARTGERRMLDYMLVAARHWMDVDVCHYSTDPLRQGGQIEHSADHVTGPVEISHEWVEGLLDYYHQTGDSFAYDTAIHIGHNILRWLDEPRYHKKGEINARETGWALRSLVALYNETYDPSWLEKADFIIGHFEQWKELYGEWLAPYTDHAVIRVPFMISIAVCSLMRYYQINPQEKIKEMIIDAMDDMMKNCILDNGLFYYKEFPSLRRLGNNTIILEALVYAYELTGDEKYLLAGIPTFQSYLQKTLATSSSKQKVGDAILLSGEGPKGFAQSFYPVVSYYVTGAKVGILDPYMNR